MSKLQKRLRHEARAEAIGMTIALGSMAAGALAIAINLIGQYWPYISILFQ